MDFNETVFLRGLIERPSEAARFSRTFKVEWLSEAKFQPILLEIFAFVRKRNMAPSCPTLHKIFVDKDPAFYKVLKPYINDIQNTEPDASLIQYTLETANDVALARSLSMMIADPHFIANIQEGKGALLSRDINKWLNMFKGNSEDKAMSLKEAIEFRMKLDNDDNSRIPTGIRPIDNWTAGGLFKKNLGIIMAGTGVGKSVALQGIAHKVALVEGKKVLFISNELSVEEMAERFMSKMAGINLTDVMNKPGKAFSATCQIADTNQLEARWKVMYYNRNVTTGDFEAELDRLRTTENWEPDVLVVDYMGRMNPKEKGYGNSDNTWNAMGAIASDLVRLAKDYNVLVWTGAQTNRKAQGGEKVTIEASQGSIQHLQEAACVVGLSRANTITLDGKDTVILRLDAIKMRQSKITPEPVFIKAELDKMHISNEIVVDYQEIYDQQNPEAQDDDTPLEKQKKKAKSKSAWAAKNDGA